MDDLTYRPGTDSNTWPMSAGQGRAPRRQEILRGTTPPVIRPLGEPVGCAGGGADRTGGRGPARTGRSPRWTSRWPPWRPTAPTPSSAASAAPPPSPARPSPAATATTALLTSLFQQVTDLVTAGAQPRRWAGHARGPMHSAIRMMRRDGVCRPSARHGSGAATAVTLPERMGRPGQGRQLRPEWRAGGVREGRLPAPRPHAPHGRAAG